MSEIEIEQAFERESKQERVREIASERERERAIRQSESERV